MTFLPVSGFGIVALLAAPAQAYATRKFRIAKPCALLVSICRNAFLIVGLLVLLSVEDVSPTQIGLGIVSGFALLSGSIVATTIVIGLDLATTRLLVSSPEARSQAVEQLENKIPRSRLEQVLFCLLAVVAAIWEELAFRGAILYVAGLWSIPIGLTVAAGALIFGAQHIGGGLSSVVYSSLMGTIFFILYLCLGSIVPVMVAHCLGNLFVVFRTYPLLLSVESKSNESRSADRPTIPL
jgi:membrane protease YdiL (CAAX protease family)